MRPVPEPTRNLLRRGVVVPATMGLIETLLWTGVGLVVLAVAYAVVTTALLFYLDTSDDSVLPILEDAAFALALPLLVVVATVRSRFGAE